MSVLFVLGGTLAGCGAHKSTGQRETVTVNGHVLTVTKIGTIKRPAALNGASSRLGACARYGQGPSGEVYACP
jgi:hypothetical protein